MTPNDPNAVPELSPEAEHRYHDYRGSVIPWFVRLLWLGFWVLAIYYTVRYLIPEMQVELVNPP